MLISMIDLHRALIANIKAGIPTMVWGPPGVGKSDIYRQIATELKCGYIDFRATLRDPVDLRGLPLIDQKDGCTRWLPPSDLPNVKKHGKTGLLVMEELPQCGDAMQKACFGLVLERRVGEYELPDGWICMANGNRRSDKSGATRMLAALANRFAHFEVEPEIGAWMAWAARTNLNPKVQAFVQFRPTYLHKMPDDDATSFPTPRAWEKVAKIIDEKDEGLRFALVNAIVGEAAATEVEAFLRTWTRLPSIDAIFKDPKSVHVPDMSEPALLFAITSALARRVTKANITNAAKYVAKLPAEFQMKFWNNAINRDEELRETKAHGEWFAANSEVLV